jgi:uncharacterized protein (UPF0335 family)
MSGIGHNSGHSEDEVLSGTAQRQLQTIVDRAERLIEDRDAVNADLKELFAEAKGNGWDVKIIRKVLRLRQMDPAKRQEEEALIDLYEHAIGGRSIAPAAEEDDDPDGVG